MSYSLVPNNHRHPRYTTESSVCNSLAFHSLGHFEISDLRSIAHLRSGPAPDDTVSLTVKIATLTSSFVKPSVFPSLTEGLCP